MKKVYLLLRNNQQTGPYSFEELLELHLKAFDLVWVEGKSCGWRYPNEIETLKTFFPAPETIDAPDAAAKPAETLKPFEPLDSHTPPPAPKKIFVSMPLNAARQSLPKQPVDDPIEQKAEELRKRALSYTAPQEPVQTNYIRNLQEAEEEYTQWAYQKKTKKKSLINKKWLAISCTGVVLLFAAWWAGSNVFKTTEPAASTTLHQTEKQEQDPVAVEEIVTSDKEPEPAKNIHVPQAAHSTSPATTNKEPAKKQTIEKQITLPEQTIATTVKPKDEAVEKIIDDASPLETQEEIVAEAPAEKKKTFKERVSELFKKKNPDEATENSQSKPVENKNGERTATRRNDDAEANAVITDVSDQVEIKTNKIADSWMMGVKNLKLTLSNRSNLTINSAKVEVLYYSEQNNLLDKKILSFSNVPPGKSQTLPAPDQRLADHIEYKILSANGVDNAYARQ
jgi:hypothetical protein